MKQLTLIGLIICGVGSVFVAVGTFTTSWRTGNDQRGKLELGVAGGQECNAWGSCRDISMLGLMDKDRFAMAGASGLATFVLGILSLLELILVIILYVANPKRPGNVGLIIMAGTGATLIVFSILFIVGTGEATLPGTSMGYSPFMMFIGCLAYIGGAVALKMADDQTLSAGSGMILGSGGGATNGTAQQYAPPVQPVQGQPAPQFAPQMQAQPMAYAQPMAPALGTPMFQGCPSCGTPFSPGSKFCANCGHSFSGQMPVPPPTNQPTRSLVIGREYDADIRLDASQVSRYHARLILQGASMFIEDNDAGNGTFVNDRPVNGRQRVQPNDSIGLGSYNITVATLLSKMKY